MNMLHLVWMTLPPGDAPGRGDRIRQILHKFGVEAQTAVALVNDGADGVSPSDTRATLADAVSSLDKADGGEDIGWRAQAGEASLVVGPFTVGQRRGVVLRFQQSDFAELDSAVRGGRLLDLIAAVQDKCDAREVIWARDMSIGYLIGMLEADCNEISPGDLDHVAAVAEVGETLTDFMEIVGSPILAGGLSFMARGWAQPNG
ncbi:hypothetical protein CA54_58320 [Symmachiella macrocystis]|uniref:Uncharacterized protein n=1 Tax=Symmachiella macrocystis TaxID=2527985 RepID=A0A5C6B3S2_9PLAN|nr:hypothetical protein [Symmachiella macrocystis]TWU05144.1 hypothetical protein CA54_58320 [Symmachiella macrocystis]